MGTISLVACTTTSPADARVNKLFHNFCEISLEDPLPILVNNST